MNLRAGVDETVVRTSLALCENWFMLNDSFWLTVGFAGQGLFTARFLVQWLASEKEREVVVPAAFWWLSILGGAALLSYAVHRRDPVIIVGQSMGLFVYARNLKLESKKRRRAARALAAAPPAPHLHQGDRPGFDASLATRDARGDRAAPDADGSARM
jgi:lipid-A-disaccharide synthase-like uncharacterized protein